MASHVWSVETEHFGYLCQTVLKPETGAYSCFASAKPLDIVVGTLSATLGPITLESDGESS